MKNNTGIYESELGIFMAGFGLAKGYAWLIVAVGTGFLGFGMSVETGMSFLYEVDSSPEVRSPCTYICTLHVALSMTKYSIDCC